MKEKSEVANLFEHFHNLVKTQFQACIQVLRTDNGREYCNSELSSYLQKNGIVHQSSCVNTPQQNGVAERKNRHLLEVARSLMLATNVPFRFWGDAILTATYLINRMPSRILHYNTPHTTLQTLFPSTRILTSLPLKIFGCTAFIHNHHPNRGKFDPTSIPCIFLGYSATHKGYKCYSPSTNKFYHSMDVTFLEHKPFYPKTQIQGERKDEFQFWEHHNSVSGEEGHQTSNQNSTPDLQNITPATSESEPATADLQNITPANLEPETATIPNKDTHLTTQVEKPLLVYSRRKKETGQEAEPPILPQQIQDSYRMLEPMETHQGITPPDPNSLGTSLNEPTDLDLPIAVRKSVRSCTLHPIGKFVSYNKLSPHYKAFVTALDSTQTPKDIQEALQHPKWEAAVKEEVQALAKNGTWELFLTRR